jgi:hypothetical protein
VTLSFDRDGAELFPAAADETVLTMVETALADLPADRAGLRLYGVAGLADLLGPAGRIGALAAAVLGEGVRPVRAILFDKTPATNWSLAWHQDRVMAVKQRVEVGGFGPWSRKHGALHVAPPFELLARMLTLRLHLDAVGPANAPLLIAPGSHRLGRVAEADMPEAVARSGTFACLAARGDAWLYATPILHASERAVEPTRRRVLQVDFAAHDLPGGLEWLGI